ncbi:Transcriptional activator protein CopR [Mesotoga infera]|uniref:Transcriptional activator protein CopR n=1 Tax=Mesotoga infera TaxID=1236046 RepID=A0A7Z7LDG4_9BACT|nr:response regulator transcription factor [Mesotoga infera]SSC12022.1 Transcriptional activator protein CopR [Mesotoga infera]
MKILVVEDEHDLGLLLKEVLENNNYAVELSADGEEGLYMALNGPFDLVVLDVLLPGLSGWEVLEGMRRKGCATPVLMLTALDGVDNKIRGFNLGADDYLSKPFDMRELLARIQSLLRRTGPVASSTNELVCGDLVLNMSDKSVYRGSTKIELRKKEYQILEYLMINRGRVISKSELEDHIWNEEDELWSDVIRSHIKNLRKKIDGGYRKKLIKTVRGMGYEISEE